MRKRDFQEMMKKQWDADKFVCVGLDSDFDKIPEVARWRYGDHSVAIGRTISSFNHEIVCATKDIAFAYKPNTAFYEAHGEDGIVALRQTISEINKIAPDVPVILDAKRADIGNTNEGYVKFAFDHLGADAITVHPYLGAEALRPFLERKEKGIFVLCRTSNPGAGEFQDLAVRRYDHLSHLHPEDEHAEPLYLNVARRVADGWNKNGNCALVVGATYPNELREIRGLVGDMPILIPGIGAQGGDVEKTVIAGKDSRGQGMIINSSRGIIFASNGADFAEAARRETEKLHNLVNQCRQKKGGE